jgi:hypothetical protein
MHDKFDNIAISIIEQHQMLITHAFPLLLSDLYNNYICEPIGDLYKSISLEIITAGI